MYYFSNQGGKSPKTLLQEGCMGWRWSCAVSGPEHPHPRQNSPTELFDEKVECFSDGVMSFIASFVLE